MKLKINFFIIFLLLVSSSTTFAQGKIDLSGVFFDGLTGEYLPTKIMAHVKGQVCELGSTDTSNKFNFQVINNIEEIGVHPDKNLDTNLVQILLTIVFRV
jgi:hypothetical protein